MLQGALRPEQQDVSEASPHAWPSESNVWLALSAETTLGFGDARFLREALSTSAKDSRLVLLFLLGGVHRSASIHIVATAAAAEELAKTGGSLVVACSAQRSFLNGLGYGSASPEDSTGYYTPHELVALAEAGLNTTMPGRAKNVYRAAKGMELICETLRLRAAGQLVPIIGNGVLSPADSLRIVAAKHLIAERFSEKLTLESIGRACGLNRAKLTRGFREMFDCSISETIAEYRLLHARKMLTGSDQRVATVGYAAGYSNNASFARAFHRRFGLPPSAFRARARGRVSGIALAA
ncbi:MAG: AraC family transcriptional regulator [Sphingomonas bacterium]|nr:AraC family transcriptional regulator [Sphingomonas bacterium]